MTSLTRTRPAFHMPHASLAEPFGLSKLEDETPVFVVGLPRSGSTLVEQILATHTLAWGAGVEQRRP